MTLAIDGSVHFVSPFGGSATRDLPPLTTTQANDIIVVTVQLRTSTIVSMTGSTLGSFIQLPGVGALGLTNVDVWVCFASAALSSEVITVVQSTGSADNIYDAFGVSGSNQTSLTGAFDAGGPTGASAAPGSITTVNANTMVLAAISSFIVTSPGASAGFTAISSADALTSIYKVLSATGTETPGTNGNDGVTNDIICFAIVQASGGGGSVNLDVPVTLPLLPPRPRQSARGAVLARWDAGALFPVSQAAAALPPIVFNQDVQPPNPVGDNTYRNNRFAALVGGDPGIARQYARFLPFAPVQNVQPPNPVGDDTWRNNRYAALVGGIANVEAIFSTAPPVLAPYWEIQSVQPPAAIRRNRVISVYDGDDGNERPSVPWINAGWQVQDPQPPAPAKHYRVAVTFKGDDGTEAQFVPPVATVNTWGFDPALPLVRYARHFDPTYIENIEAQEINFYPFGFDQQPVQPPHRAPERRFAFAPISNIEAVFVPPVAVPLNFWETNWPQPPHRRVERAGAIMPFPSIEGTYVFVPPPVFTMWEAVWPQPPARPRRQASQPVNIEGLPFTAPVAPPTQWESVFPQPPHPRPERAAAMAPQSPVEGVYINFQPFGWHVAPPEPHPRPERAGAIQPPLGFVETPLTRFIPFWMMAPPHPEPHPRREKAGSIVPPLALTESRLRIFYPTFWHVLPPEPHPVPNRGAGLLPAGILPIIKFRAVVLNPNYIAVGRPRVMVSLGMPRQRISVGAPRNRVVLGVANQVSQTNELLPPIDSTVEIETVTFDYGLILAAGVTVTSIASITCQVLSGTDPTPASRLVGAASIGTSPNSGGTNQAVFQQVGTMVGGVTYRLQCVANCSDGQVISLWNHLSCQTPN